MAAKLIYGTYRQTWNIGLCNAGVSAVAGLEGEGQQRAALERIIWMKETRKAFKADPFLAPHPTKTSSVIILYEHFEWSRKLGNINAVVWDGSNFSEPVLALDSVFHLSYPYVLYDNKDVFFIPEHSKARDVSCFWFDSEGRAIKKKSIWSRSDAVDSSLVRIGNVYWLFCTIAGPDANSALYLYYSEDVEGPWKAHHTNPVKVDTSSARPAGQLFFHKGDVFRPSQNCQNFYGESIKINRIEKLSPTEFKEVMESEVRPHPAWDRDFGLHTISNLGERTVVDSGRLESKFHPMLDKLNVLLRKVLYFQFSD